MSRNPKINPHLNPQIMLDLPLDKDSQDHSQAHPHKIGNARTSQISTQVNMDEEFPEIEEQKRRKREKKKEYKRRKRERQKDQEKQARDILAEIITRIYQGETSFKESKNEIQYCLRWLVSGEKFHTFLNQVIRIHVKNIQNDMWKFMQDTIHENPFEKSDEDQEFYIMMIDKIYNQYQKLQISSREIEEIINLYMLLKQNKQQADHYDLDRSTFNYFIESDETIKNLIKICQRRLHLQHQKQMRELKEICEMMNSDEDEEDYYYDDDPDQQYTEKSTSVDEEEQTEQKNAKRKKKKHKKGDFSTSFFDVVKRITETVIVKDKRTKSEISEEWVMTLIEKFQDEVEEE